MILDILEVLNLRNMPRYNREFGSFSNPAIFYAHNKKPEGDFKSEDSIRYYLDDLLDELEEMTFASFVEIYGDEDPFFNIVCECVNTHLSDKYTLSKFGNPSYTFDSIESLDADEFLREISGYVKSFPESLLTSELLARFKRVNNFERPYFKKSLKFKIYSLDCVVLEDLLEDFY